MWYRRLSHARATGAARGKDIDGRSDEIAPSWCLVFLQDRWVSVNLAK